MSILCFQHFPGMGPGGPDGSLGMGPEMSVMNGKCHRYHPKEKH